MFKWLKKILPPPVNSFNREIQFLKDYIKVNNNEIIKLQNELIKKVQADQTKLSSGQIELDKKLNSLSDKQEISENKLDAIFSDISVGKQDALLSKIEEIFERQKKYCEEQEALISQIKNIYERQKRYIDALGDLNEKNSENKLMLEDLESQLKGVLEKINALMKKYEVLEAKQDEIRLAAEMRTRKDIPNSDIEKQLWALAGRRTAEYVSERMFKCKVFDKPESLREFAVLQSGEGLYLEFGVCSGKSINQISSLKKEKTIYGFDSFEGLPETWRSGFEKGKFAKDTLPQVNDNVVLIKGWFEDALPEFIKDKDEICAFIHVDCDLYTSTKTVFKYLADKIKTGTIILFDEYFNYPGWRENEFLAFQEFIKNNNLNYKYIGYVKNFEQVVVRIL